jgi:hypothetical protein
MAEIDDQAPKTERGTPLRAYNIPGGPYPSDLPPVRVPRTAEYERGSAQDRLGNRGR